MKNLKEKPKPTKIFLPEKIVSTRVYLPEKAKPTKIFLPEKAERTRIYLPEKERELELSDYLHPWERFEPIHSVDEKAEGLYKSGVKTYLP